MAVTYTATEARQGRSIGFSGDADRAEITWSTSYNVVVTGATSASQVDPYEVVTASGLPIVNKSIYSFASKIIPYAICRSKQANMEQGSPYVWRVDCRYRGALPTASNESDDAPISPPANLSDITPRVTPELGEIEKVLYVDKSNEPQRIQLPSGNWWAEPVMERVPTLTLKITQYENYISYEDLLERKLKTNSKEYRSQLPGKWLITGIDPIPVTVTLQSGDVDAALVTYTVELSPHDAGWKDERALFDTVWRSRVDQKWRLFQGDTEFVTSRPATVDKFGYLVGNTKLGQATNEADGLQYIAYQTQDEIDFGTFLQV